MDRRHSIRYLLQFDVRFSWTIASRRAQAQGLTKDLSVHGVYVSCAQEDCPPPDSVVELTVSLPRLSADPNRMLLKMKGRVIRTSSAEDAGVAAQDGNGAQQEIGFAMAATAEIATTICVPA